MHLIYKAPLDNVAKITTGIISLLILFMLLKSVYILITTALLMPLLISISFVISYSLLYLHSPIKYSIQNDAIRVHRLIGNVIFKKCDIKKLALVDKDVLKNAYRTFGVAALFGYWGRYTITKIGRTTWYARHKNMAVLITTITNKKIIITPGNCTKFIKDYTCKV